MELSGFVMQNVCYIRACAKSFWGAWFTNEYYIHISKILHARTKIKGPGSACANVLICLCIYDEHADIWTMMRPSWCMLLDGVYLLLFPICLICEASRCARSYIYTRAEDVRRVAYIMRFFPLVHLRSWLFFLGNLIKESTSGVCVYELINTYTIHRHNVINVKKCKAKLESGCPALFFFLLLLLSLNADTRWFFYIAKIKKKILWQIKYTHFFHLIATNHITT